MAAHGSSRLTPEGTDANEKRFGFRYLHIADGSTGGPIPGKRYGEGRMAVPGKKAKGKR